MNKKICFFGNYNSIHVKRWINCFIDDSSFSVHVISNTAINDIKGQENTLYLPHFGSWNVIGRLKNLLRNLYFIRKKNIDVYHIHFITYSNIEVLFIPKKVRVIGTVWGADIMGDERWKNKNPIVHWIKTLLVKRILNRCTIITYHSEYLNWYLKQKYNIQEQKLKFVSFGINLISHHAIDTKQSQTVRDVYNIPRGSSCILCPRQIGEVYNTLSLIKVMKKLGNEGYHLVLKDYHGISPYRDFIKEEMQKNNLESVVTIIDYLPEEEYRSLFLSCDIIISLSEYDGLSIGVLEAMAYKKPVIMSMVPANIMEFGEKDNLFVEPNDIESIIELIRNITSDYTERIEERNFEYIQKHDRRKNMIQMADLYNSI